jgi:CBS domain-containing protein
MEMRVKQCMSKPAVVCHLDDTLHEAAKRMWENDCGVLPVMTPEGHVAAMITDRDICMAAYTQGQPLHAIKVSGVMSRTVHACSPDDSVEAAEKLMRDHQVRRLPVVDEDGHLSGLISLNDLARASAKQLHHKADGLNPVRVASTLASICEPRAVVAIATPLGR